MLARKPHRVILPLLFGAAVLLAPISTSAIHPEAQENLAVILVDFPDFQPAHTAAAVVEAMNAIPTYWANASYGQTQVIIHSTQWLHSTLSFLGPNRDGVGGLICDRDGFIKEAIRLADNQIDFRNITVVMPIHPSPPGFNFEAFPCLPGGGAGGAMIERQPFTTNDGEVMLGNAVVGEGIIWITDRPHTQIHEFTHTYGLNHEIIIYCGSEPLAPDLKSCIKTNVSIDVMSLEANGDLNAASKDMLGLFNSTYSVNTVTTPGTYTINTLGRQSPGIKALKIQRNATDTLYLEYRRPQGNDAAINIIGGVVHAILPNAQEWFDYYTYVVPIDPTSESGNYVLDIGETWYDRQSHWAFTPTARNTAEMTVQVDRFPPIQCSPATTSANPNTIVTFTVAGGMSPYEWYGYGDPEMHIGDSHSEIFTEAGVYTISVKPVGRSVSSSCNVYVGVSPPIPPAPSNLRVVAVP